MYLCVPLHFVCVCVRIFLCASSTCSESMCYCECFCTSVCVYMSVYEYEGAVGGLTFQGTSLTEAAL